MEFEKVRKIIAEQMDVPVEEISPSTAFVTDLGMDSVDILRLIIEIEKEFDIALAHVNTKKLFTVADAVDCIRRLIK